MGLTHEPGLARISYSHDYQEVELNTRIVGDIAHEEARYFNLETTSDQRVALVLSGNATDIDLSVWDTLSIVSKGSFQSGSKEALVFEAEAYRTYAIEVFAFEGSGSYELKVVQANRESLGLRANEIYVVAEGEAVEICDGELGSHTQSNFPMDYDYIYNMASGAVRGYGYSIDHYVTYQGTREVYEYMQGDLYSDRFVSGTGQLLYRYNENAGFYGRELWEHTFEEAGFETLNCRGQVEFSSSLSI